MQIMRPYFRFCWTPLDWALPLQIAFSMWKNINGTICYEGHVHVLFMFWQYKNWEYDEE